MSKEEISRKQMSKEVRIVKSKEVRNELSKGEISITEKK